MSPGAALRFEEVAAVVGGREVLRRVTLAVGRGEVVALAGRNGAGKTTLLRVASRVLARSRGRIWVGEREIDALTRRELAAEVAVVPQDVAIPFPFSAGEVVLMGRTPHLAGIGFESRDDVAKAHAAMERVGVAELADRSILELSGGERQLVLVARALAQEPRLLLLDEPTAHLDLLHRVTVLEQVLAFVAGGGSALVVSHDLALAARTSDRMALLAEGEVRAVGPPGAVLTPETLRAVFGVEADVSSAPDGSPVVVPRAGRGAAR